MKSLLFLAIVAWADLVPYVEIKLGDQSSTFYTKLNAEVRNFKEFEGVKINLNLKSDNYITGYFETEIYETEELLGLYLNGSFTFEKVCLFLNIITIDYNNQIFSLLMKLCCCKLIMRMDTLNSKSALVNLDISLILSLTVLV